MWVVLLRLGRELGTTLYGDWSRSDKTQVPVLWTGLGLAKWGLDKFIEKDRW